MVSEVYWYWLNNIEGIGYQTIEKMLRVDKNPQNIFKWTKEDWKGILTLKQQSAFVSSRDFDKIKKKYVELKEKKIDFYSIANPNYPKRLRIIENPPFCLYVRGKLPQENEKTIGIIGARDGTVYGQEMARYYGKEFSKLGISVISGMARGIDGIAQQSTLDYGGVSYAVLGCGVNICYPKENFSLYQNLIKQGGIISEYSPDTVPKAGLFPRRNRIISGLADNILVIESKEKSGTWITVDWALEQGKDIFAVPGRAFEPYSEGCNQLIQMGAKLVKNIEDFYEEYQIEKIEKRKNCEKNLKTLDKNQKVVYSCLSLEPKYLDNIRKETNLSAKELLSILFHLEMIGYVRQIVPNYYIRCEI